MVLSFHWVTRPWVLSFSLLVQNLISFPLLQRVIFICGIIVHMKSPFSRLTKNAKKVVNVASNIADQMGESDLHVEHLFVALLLVKEGIASRVLTAMNVDVEQTAGAFANGADLSRATSKSGEVTKKIAGDAAELLKKSFDISRKHNHVYVGTEHMLLALIEDSNSDLVKELRDSGLRVEEVKDAIFSYTVYPKGILSKPSKNGKEGEGPTALDVFGKDLTALAAQGKLDPLVGREDEVDQMIKVLSRRRKNNPVVVGEAGVGKTALVEGLAQRIVKGEVPESLRGTRIVSLNVTGIVAGSKMRGDMEEKMAAVINEIASSPKTILFIDEIHAILGAGSTSGGGLDLAGVLKPALVHGNFRCIGATTVAEYSRYFEEEAALSRRFQKVDIEETTPEDTVKILERLRSLLEKHHNVVITDEAIDSAVRLSDQYVSDRYLPDKAIDLMDEAAASRRLEMEGKYDDLSDAVVNYRKIVREKEGAVSQGDLDKASGLRRKEKKAIGKISDIKKKRGQIKKSKEHQVDADIVRNVVSKWTGIPLTTLGAEESSKLIKLEETLEDFVVGQEEAVEKVANAIKRARTGVTSGDRPWASFLFLGPTGVGKTELAKVLTKELFGSDDRLIQIDMSEMMEMHSVSKLIGSPPGYVGHREGGQLTEQVRRNPHSVILFDEIEKAHIDVLNVLLQILEYGHMTDGKGRRVNFKNTVIILTSNIGAEEIRKDKVLGFAEREDDENKGERSDSEIEEAYDGMKETLLDELKDTLRPELLNRLDDVVIFRSLTRKDARGIVKILLDELNDRLGEQGIKVKLTKGSVDFIVERGFSEECGARPLRRTIQEYVETPVASYLLRYGGGVVVKGRKRKKKTLTVEKAKGKEKLVVKKG